MLPWRQGRHINTKYICVFVSLWRADINCILMLSLDDMLTFCKVASFLELKQTMAGCELFEPTIHPDNLLNALFHEKKGKSVCKYM